LLSLYEDLPIRQLRSRELLRLIQSKAYLRYLSKDSEKHEELNTDSEKTAPKQKFEPVKGKYRKPGTGCVSKINDNLWEGRYTPTVNGKRMARNVYAHTEEEREEKLAQMIREMKAEIEKLKQGG
jgi:hypothetical protein